MFLKDPEKYSGSMPPETDVLLQLAKGLEYIHRREVSPSRHQAPERTHQLGFYNPTNRDEKGRFWFQ